MRLKLAGLNAGFSGFHCLGNGDERVSPGWNLFLSLLVNTLPTKQICWGGLSLNENKIPLKPLLRRP
jgi:hypothetical protein